MLDIHAHETHEVLGGRTVFVVEDNGLLCCVIEETLRDAGCKIVGPYVRLSEAMAAAPTADIDVALLDVNVRGELISPLAQQLEQRGVPYLLTSAYHAADLPGPLRSAMQLRKPYTDADLLDKLAELISARSRNH
jgi:CheY-like chemotaxis protein